MSANAQTNSELQRHILRDLVLETEDVGYLAVIRLGKNVHTIGTANHLPGDSKPCAAAPHAAFEYVADPQGRCDGSNVLVFSFERISRGAGDDLEFLDLRQGGRDLFREAVAEVLILGRATQVGKRQDH